MDYVYITVFLLLLKSPITTPSTKQDLDYKGELMKYAKYISDIEVRIPSQDDCLDDGIPLKTPDDWIERTRQYQSSGNDARRRNEYHSAAVRSGMETVI